MCDPLLPQMSHGNTQRGLTLLPMADIAAFSHLFYLDPSLLLTLSFLFFSSSLNRYFQPASRKNISLKLSVLKPRLECLCSCVEYLPLLEQWCYCSAMSAPCLSFHPMSCDCWVMSPCQLCHRRDTLQEHQHSRIFYMYFNDHCNVTVHSEQQ